MIHPTVESFLRKKKRINPNWGEKYKISKKTGKKSLNTRYDAQQRALNIATEKAGQKVEREKTEWNNALRPNKKKRVQIQMAVHAECHIL